MKTLITWLYRKYVFMPKLRGLPPLMKWIAIQSEGVELVDDLKTLDEAHSVLYRFPLVEKQDELH